MYKNILLSVDLNETASWVKALPTSIDLAKTYEATLHVVTVVPDFGMAVVGGFFPADFEEKAMADQKEKLKAFCSKNVPEDITVEAIVRYGHIYEEIIDVAEEISADLIVMGSHRPELKDYLLGPNAARVMRHANCSVLVVRE
ncbi:MAG: universal stress protein [Rhodospirillales bacterium]|nr:universal stress protein [Alphaproteobacteria bacterium]MBL6947264.1 universal stress protein [Rhodospirillales bacterium]